VESVVVGDRCEPVDDVSVEVTAEESSWADP
jgi:hypothetical protein